MNLYDLRTENQTTVLALPPSSSGFRPRFSWKLASDDTNVLQATYRLQVSTDPDFANMTWDSGEVKTRQSHLVPYSGPSLSQSTRYWFRVKVVSNAGLSSSWSQRSWFETALQGPWTSAFVSPDRPKEKNRAPLGRLGKPSICPSNRFLPACMPPRWECMSSRSTAKESLMPCSPRGGRPTKNAWPIRPTT